MVSLKVSKLVQHLSDYLYGVGSLPVVSDRLTYREVKDVSIWFLDRYNGNPVTASEKYIAVSECILSQYRYLISEASPSHLLEITTDYQYSSVKEINLKLEKEMAVGKRRAGNAMIQGSRPANVIRDMTRPVTNLLMAQDSQLFRSKQLAHIIVTNETIWTAELDKLSREELVEFTEWFILHGAFVDGSLASGILTVNSELLKLLEGIPSDELTTPLRRLKITIKLQASVLRGYTNGGNRNLLSSH